MATADVELDFAINHARQLLEAIGTDITGLPETDRQALTLIAFSDPVTVAAVCRLIDQTHNVSARQCTSLGCVGG